MSTSSMLSLELDRPIWDRFFTVAPLVLIGSREPDGTYDFAPKHMAMPMGWGNLFGFICTPRHATYRNVVREEVFTVTYPRPDQVVMSSLAAGPRCEDQTKPILQTLDTVEAEQVEGRFVENGYLHLGCTLERIVEGFGVNGLVVGKIVEAHVRRDALRVSEYDDQELLREAPLLAYLHPGYFTRIREALAFPFPEGFSR